MASEDYNNGSATNAANAGRIEQIENQLRQQFMGRIRDFRLVVHPSFGVIMYGQAETYYTKQLVQHAVMRAVGLSIYQNAIEVASAEGYGDQQPCDHQRFNQ